MDNRDDHELENIDEANSDESGFTQGASMDNTQNDSIMRLPEVIRETGHCRSMIYRLMRDGLFPASAKTSKRSVGWSRRAVQTYIRVTLAGGKYRASAHQQ
jgi:prophage regulatory protein